MRQRTNSFFPFSAKSTNSDYNCNLIVSACAKFEECAAKTVGGVGFLRVTGFSKKHYCQISSHGCQFDGLDFKLSKHD